MYFQVHQPYRLRRYSVFDSQGHYFDDVRNQKILDKVVAKCYEPATSLLLELVRKHEGRFRFGFCLTGIILEQLRQRHPQVIKLLQQLAATGCVEFLNETYHHSLAFLYSRDEFRAQVEMHAKLVDELFGQRPKVFRNTELIYSNELAAYIKSWGQHKVILSEGADHVLLGRAPNVVFHPPGDPETRLLLKNYKLSDDIAFRFSNPNFPEYPVTAPKYAKAVAAAARNGTLRPSPGSTYTVVDQREQGLCNLFLDFETFGEHQWPETGIFDFLRELPERFLEVGLSFSTPSQAAEALPPSDEYDVPHMISWADTERDLSAWLGNAMQSNALHELYKLEQPVKQTGDAELLEDWRRLTSSDHFYYMCTKYFADQDVHKYFNPYESPYDSYINFMNVLDHLRSRVAEAR